jgi:hypothetical protein
MGERHPDQGYGCAIYVSEDGRQLHGAYGSVVLDGSSAMVTKPGSFAPATVVCDFCYMENVRRSCQSLHTKQKL